MTEPRARNEVGYGEQKGSKQRRFARQAASTDQRPHHHDSCRRDAETHRNDLSMGFLPTRFVIRIGRL
jgi:hypothetical protein